MNNRCITKTALSLAAFLGYLSTSHAIDFNPNYSLILDGHYKSEKSALSETDKGFGLGHVELSISSPVDDLFFGKLTAVLHSHDSKTDVETEEAFIQTLALPGGLSVRAGRFLSDFGYLNSQHTHTDSFTERPAVYRALLGSHYFDDGVRVSYLMPTDIYWNIGAEAFSGKKLRANNIKDPNSVGVYNFFTKIGGDFNHEHSWQIGFNYLRNENGTSPRSHPVEHHAHNLHQKHHDEEEHHHHDHHEHHEKEHHHKQHDANLQHSDGNHSHHSNHHHDHHHCHKASYTGKDLYGVEAVWKWAPEGNYKYRHLSLSAEYLQARNITDNKTIKSSDDKHDGWYLSSVYQFAPQWATGIRYGEFNGLKLENDHHHKNSLQETELMLSWSHSHFSTIRLQWTHQKGKGLEHINDNIITLQYVMSLGAHDAHQF
ncbi:hypothetical protein NX722_23010 [Endozoicomonas gorgoniicola]|uniref:Zinc-regulated TonB-dependent outer membrane receptor n=1 Tax=Endozoicomonas gorgoniicola TaxID=1234144 RepID=A0ABT3N1E0_9GAMM|nr:hypothetical protein [Endozoicomonas gorgoniicola]MCW7555441.1 hypothetical protein [Endozoicomonas gorgoniicola]